MNGHNNMMKKKDFIEFDNQKPDFVLSNCSTLADEPPSSNHNSSSTTFSSSSTTTSSMTTTNDDNEKAAMAAAMGLTIMTKNNNNHNDNNVDDNITNNTKKQASSSLLSFPTKLSVLDVAMSHDGSSFSTKKRVRELARELERKKKTNVAKKRNRKSDIASESSRGTKKRKVNCNTKLNSSSKNNNITNCNLHYVNNDTAAAAAAAAAAATTAAKISNNPWHTTASSNVEINTTETAVVAAAAVVYPAMPNVVKHRKPKPRKKLEQQHLQGKTTTAAAGETSTTTTTTPPKRRRGRPKGSKTKCHPLLNRPKRPHTAYNLFFSDQRKQLIDSQSLLLLREGHNGSVSSDDESDDEEDQDHNADQRHNEEPLTSSSQLYKQNPQGGNNGSETEIKSRRCGKDGNSVRMRFPNLARIVASRWKSIDPSVKAKYDEQAKRLYAKHQCDMTLYNIEVKKLEKLEQEKKAKQKEEEEEANRSIKSSTTTSSSSTPTTTSSTTKAETTKAASFLSSLNKNNDEKYYGDDNGTDQDNNKDNNIKKNTNASYHEKDELRVVRENNETAPNGYMMNMHSDSRLIKTTNTSRDVNKGLKTTKHDNNNNNNNSKFKNKQQTGYDQQQVSINKVRDKLQQQKQALVSNIIRNASKLPPHIQQQLLFQRQVEELLQRRSNAVGTSNIHQRHRLQEQQRHMVTARDHHNRQQQSQHAQLLQKHYNMVIPNVQHQQQPQNRLLVHQQRNISATSVHRQQQPQNQLLQQERSIVSSVQHQQPIIPSPIALYPTTTTTAQTTVDGVAAVGPNAASASRAVLASSLSRQSPYNIQQPSKVHSGALAASRVAMASLLSRHTLHKMQGTDSTPTNLPACGTRLAASRAALATSLISSQSRGTPHSPQQDSTTPKGAKAALPRNLPKNGENVMSKKHQSCLMPDTERRPMKKVSTTNLDENNGSDIAQVQKHPPSSSVTIGDSTLDNKNMDCISTSNIARFVQKDSSQSTSNIAIFVQKDSSQTKKRENSMVYFSKLDAINDSNNNNNNNQTLCHKEKKQQKVGCKTVPAEVSFEKIREIAESFRTQGVNNISESARMSSEVSKRKKRKDLGYNQNCSDSFSDNVEIDTDSGLCTANVNVPSASFPGNCAVDTSSCNKGGGNFPLGDTIVSCGATDPSGNSKSCSYSVTVKDNEDPTITCPGPIVLGTADIFHDADEEVGLNQRIWDESNSPTQGYNKNRSGSSGDIFHDADEDVCLDQRIWNIPNSQEYSKNNNSNSNNSDINTLSTFVGAASSGNKIATDTGSSVFFRKIADAVINDNKICGPVRVVSRPQHYKFKTNLIF